MNRKLICVALSGAAGLGMAWTLTTTVEAATTVITGTSGDDRIVGTSRGDSIDGRAGDDVIFGRDGGDGLYGGRGHNELHGNRGPDLLADGPGPGLVYGGRGNDYADIGTGADRIWLRRGDDRVTIWEEGRRDVIHCGPGQDRIYYLTTERDPRDRLFGCEVIEDNVPIDKLVDTEAYPD
jgi:Ca2+-binding RTX toxin-like protein